jgi:hypothetical protein
MKTYEIILAREEIRTVTIQIEAKDEEEAQELAHDILTDTEFNNGRHVHGDQWVQEVNPIN